MGSSLSKNIVAGSNPSLQVSGSNPAMPVSGSNPALPISLTNPSISSISVVRRKSPFLPIFISLLVIFTLALLVVGGIHTLRITNELKVEAKTQEKMANTVKHVNPQPVHKDSELGLLQPPSLEDTTISFNLITDPPGANIYKDDEFLATTPVDLRLEKSDTTSRIVIELIGHQIERREINMANNFSDRIALTHVAMPTVVNTPRPVETKQAQAVTVNNAIRVDSSAAQPANANKKNNKKTKSNAKAVSNEVVIPIIE